MSKEGRGQEGEGGSEAFGSSGMINRGRLRLVRVESLTCPGCEIFPHPSRMR